LQRIESTLKGKNVVPRFAWVSSTIQEWDTHRAALVIRFTKPLVTIYPQPKLPDDDEIGLTMVSPCKFIQSAKDAIVMERLTASPRIVDAYGLLWNILWRSIMPSPKLQYTALTGKSRSGVRQPLPALRTVNNYTIEEKLDAPLKCQKR
jgi:hypothetical protein